MTALGVVLVLLAAIAWPVGMGLGHQMRRWAR